MFAAVSTACLYPLETERALQTLLRLGISAVEIFINTESEMEPAFLDGLRQRADAAGARICSLHLHTSSYEPMMFFTDYPRRFDDSLRRYRTYFSAARELGASVVIFHGDRRDGGLPAAEYYERVARLSDAARGEGVVLGQENVARCRTRDAGLVKNMREYMGNGRVKFVLDCKQALRSQSDPFKMLAAMGTDVAHVHISDSGSAGDCLLPGHGTFDFRRFIDKLAAAGYDGALVLEVYRSAFRRAEELREGYDVLRSMLL